MSDRYTPLPYDERDAAVDAACAKFPERFGLRAFPGEVFTVVRGQSFYSTGNRDYEMLPSIQLYVFIVKEDGSTLAFSKGTPEELSREVVAHGCKRFVRANNGRTYCIDCDAEKEER